MQNFGPVRSFIVSVYSNSETDDRQIDTDRSIDQQTDRQTDRKTDGWTDRQTDRQTDRLKPILLHFNIQWV